MDGDANSDEDEDEDVVAVGRGATKAAVPLMVARMAMAEVKLDIVVGCSMNCRFYFAGIKVQSYDLLM